MPNGGFLDTSQENAPEVVTPQEPQASGTAVEFAPVETVPIETPEAAVVNVETAAPTTGEASSVESVEMVETAAVEMMEHPINDGVETAEEKKEAETAMEELPPEEVLETPPVVASPPQTTLAHQIDEILSKDLAEDLAHLTDRERALFLKAKPEVAAKAAVIIQREKDKRRKKQLILLMLRWLHALPKTNIAYPLSEAKEKALAVAAFAEDRDHPSLPD